MVCKEDVLSWFKDLEGYKRIDVMFELLNMCVPFEIRYLGTCLEEIGKHSYQELRGPAIVANDFDKLSKETSLTQNLLDEHTRHRVLIYMSLLSSRNCNCANWMYKTLFRTESVETFVVSGSCIDENLHSELLLLFTLALHHPAFTFEQKSFFGRLVTVLLTQKEGRKNHQTKPQVHCQLPGFNHPNSKIPSHADIPIIPVKTASSVCHGDIPLHQHHPPGLPTHPLAAAPLDFITAQNMWSRSGFAGTVSGAPEVPPFPPPTISPLVSQSTSPTPSRAASPHRNFMRQAPPMQPLNHVVDVAPIGAPIELLSQPSLPFNSEVKNNDDEQLNHIPDDKIRETSPWMPTMLVPAQDIKQPNGIRIAMYSKLPQQYIIDQMQALNLEGENSLHCSSSNSSSNSSLNHTPPETPTVTPSITPHGPGRGDNKPRMNGIPAFINPGPQTINTGPMCDTTPPPPPALSNCSVPYSNYPPHVSYTPIPNRSLFHYTQAYRPPFYQPTENIVYSTYPYFMFSSAPPQLPLRNPHCYNCGATGHVGAECSTQTIEEITQKKAYTLEFNSSLPDIDK